MSLLETHFPRGKGIVTPSDNTIKRKSRDEDLFKTNRNDDVNTVKKKKIKKKQRKSTNDDDDDNEKIVIESLNVNTLPEGINIYGCIQMIKDYELRVSLPGGVIAKVPITNICDAYTQLLEKVAYNSSEMSDFEVLKPNGMFRIGQYFPVKILSKTEAEGFGMTEVIASMNPKDIYADVKSSTLMKINNVVIVAAVMSVEDYGYIMDIGLSDVKAFLSNDKAQCAIQMIEGRKSLAIGQLVTCAIESVVNERSVKLTTKSKILSHFKITNNMIVPLSCLIPGTVVTGTVMDITERGLELNVITDYKGFVHRNHLKTVWELPKKHYKIADKVFGTVLYVHPVTKQISVSLRSKMNRTFVNDFPKQIKIGTIIEESIVMGKDERGSVIFKLPGDVKAIAQRKHLFDLNDPKRDAEDDDDNSIDTKFPIGSNHKCRVKSINFIDSLAKVTLRPSLLNRSFISIEQLTVGDIIKGTVKKLLKSGILIHIGFGLKGYVPNIHLCDFPVTMNRENLFPLNKQIKCRILKIDSTSSPPRIRLTCKKSLLKKELKLIKNYDADNVNVETDGVIFKVKSKGIIIEFFGDAKGWIPIRFLNDYQIDDCTKVFNDGQIIRCTIVHVDKENERMTLSLTKRGKKKDKNKNESKSSEMSIKDLSIGSIINGKIVKILSEGVLMKFGSFTGYVPKIHLTDDPLDNPNDVSVGNEMKCRVLKLDSEKTPPKVTLTCKKALLEENLIILSDYNNIEPNQNVTGVVVFVSKKGILLEFFNDIKGWVPIRNMKLNRIQFPEDSFKKGQIVECTIESIQLESKRITCALINKNLQNDKKKRKNKNKEHNDTVNGNSINNNTINNDGKRKRNNSLTSESDRSETNVKYKNTKPSLSVDAFKWDIDDATPNLTKIETYAKMESSTDSENSDDEKTVKRRKTRVERSEENRQREKQLRLTEERLMDTERTPETVEDYERSVLASPNSSLVWLQYAAFYLEQAEVDKARAVARRALTAISFREEQEKLNIWYAMLNLENLYGTENSLEETLNEALQQNDQFKIYSHLASLYLDSEKHESAESLYNTIVKKFKNDPNSWIDFGLYYMKIKKPESARKLMQKCLKSLDKRHHLNVISKFGQMEFKYGDNEHGKTIFENILASYPKRIDLWSVYLDLMIKYSNDDNNSNIDSVRNIFERLITHKLPARKMKFIFKRYIDFETKYGNSDRIERIRQKALEYVEAKFIE